MRAVLVAMAILALPATALPCDPYYPGAWKLDPAEVGLDVQPPGPAGLAKLEVIRGVRPLFDSGPESSCGDGDGSLGAEVNVILDLAEDDRTASQEIGYRIELSGRHLPRGYSAKSWVTLPNGASIVLGWQERDDDELLDFTIRLTPLDRAGNEGPTLVVPVRDEGLGCAAAGGGAGAFPLVAALAFLAARASRLRRHYRAFARRLARREGA